MDSGKHRADIQSLRALAVVMVVAAHAGVPWLEGGYVGVDAFFVLSGYLISGLILREAETSGRFDAWGFYARRLKRLLPALLLVLAATALLGWFLAPPLQQPTQAGAGQAASLWLSNFWFAARKLNYFDQGLGHNLFLHTWSLGVEEQFYLVWPWLMLFSWGAWRWQGRPRSRKRLAVGLLMLTAASLFLNIHLAGSDIEADFYLMPPRAWEFALGALVFLARNPEHGISSPWLTRLQGRSLLNLSGWAFILMASVLYREDLRYPGLWALLPCLGAALVLMDHPEKRPHSPVSRFMLRVRAVQYLGNVSYSLYLWHWPVLLLGQTALGDTPLARAGLAGLALALAGLTRHFVEDPWRHLPLPKQRTWGLSVLAMTLAFAGLGAWQAAAEQRIASPEQAHIQGARLDVPKIYEDGCDTWYHSAELSPCSYGPPTARNVAVMFGDSILAQWFPAVETIYLNRPNWKLVVLTKSACPTVEASFYYDRIKSEYRVCELWRKRAIEEITRLRPDVLIMGSGHYGFAAEQWLRGTRAVLERVAPASGRIFVLSPPPKLGIDGPDCLSATANLPAWLDGPSRCERRAPVSEQALPELLREAATPYPNTQVLDLAAYVCPDSLCRARIGDVITYRDSQHLTATFVRTLTPAFQEKLKTTHGRD